MKVSDVISELGIIDEINGTIESALDYQKGEEMTAIPTDYIIDIQEVLSRYKTLLLDKETK